jgi:hypothetical protein
MKKVFASLIIIIPIALQSFAAPPASRYREFLFGVDYYPEQWSEQYWERDAQRMKEIGVNAVRMGEFGWSLIKLICLSRRPRFTIHRWFSTIRGSSPTR